MAAPAIAAPVLDFPEPGLDDPAAYAGYRTRFFRDAAGNTFQIYIAGDDGRVVNVWANGANESLGFTARDPADRPVALDWGGPGARVVRAGGTRSMEYELRSDAPELRLGLFVLGTMRFERDVQYQALHRGPLTAALRLPELVELVEVLDRLGDADPETQARHLGLLGAADTDALRARLEPRLELREEAGRWRFRATQPGFDGRGQLVLEISAPAAAAEPRLEGRVLAVRSRGGGPLRLIIRTTTSAPALTPLGREEIFNRAFLGFMDSLRVEYASAGRSGSGEGAGEALRYRRLERQVVATELLSSREKLMAGLPNFGTYFGRDMLMTALMMEAIWAPEMMEHVLASALRKLAADGDVSHEEALGGQVVREAAAEYTRLVRRHLDTTRPELLDRARAELESLSHPRENHRMVDDDFQLPIVAARWLTDARVPAARKRDFLLEPAGEALPPRRDLLLRNLELVARRTAAYARDPRPENLISFPRDDGGRWFPGSWRDSGPGYGNGRYALDVNAIWAPHALAALGTILDGLEALGVPARVGAQAQSGSPLGRYITQREALRRDVATWRGSAAHFLVELDAATAREAIERRLSALPDPDARHWRAVLARSPDHGRPLRFPAIALDAAGRPVPILNTDPGMAILLGDLERSLGEVPPLEAVAPVLEPYPLGLLVEGLGPLVANDAFADTAVWSAFDRDPYHSPRTVWGREVNVLLLGLAARIADAYDGGGRLRAPALAGTVRGLRDALERVRAAADASGLRHTELWSYRIGPSGLEPVRFGTSTDIQLWNATELAVQYALSRLPPGS